MIMINSNFHTHTRYCDGADTPEEIIERAVELGFASLGFSEHSYGICDEIFGMTAENQEKYRAEILMLKEKYKDKISIFCGIEADSFSNINRTDFDYVISSAHYVKKAESYLSVDLSAEEETKNVEQLYGGDFDSYAEDYFNEVYRGAEKSRPDIIGHLDLVMKFCDINGRTETPRYLAAAEECIKKTVKICPIFEINTGAVARGYRKTPYPSEKLLRLIKKYGGEIMISSDCHDKNSLTCEFEAAEALAKKIGFTKRAVITQNGIEFVKI